MASKCIVHALKMENVLSASAAKFPYMLRLALALDNKHVAFDTSNTPCVICIRKFTMTVAKSNKGR